MSKIPYSKLLTCLLLLSISMACRLPSILAAQPETETPLSTATAIKTRTPAPTASPTRPATRVPVATVAVVPGPALPKFAPFCQPSSASIATPIQCQEPIAAQSSSFCQDKAPYNLVLINPGATYESLNEKIECSNAEMKDGKQLLVCSGPMAISFELKVCDPSCALKPFQALTTHCPEGLNFNESLQCCEREPIAADANCVVLSLQTRSCSTNCGEFTSQSTCEKNAYACEWDFERVVCEPRK